MSHIGASYRPNDISLSRANQSQAKFKSAVGGNLLQSWVNLTIVSLYASKLAKGLAYTETFVHKQLAYSVNIRYLTIPSIWEESNSVKFPKMTVYP